MNRRGFLKSFGALAAAAVAGTALVPLSAPAQNNLVASMRGGVVEDQVFYFDRPITIEIPDLIIRRCKFIFTGDFGGEAAITVIARNLAMADCHIDTTGVVDSQFVMNFPGLPIPDVPGRFPGSITLLGNYFERSR